VCYQMPFDAGDPRDPLEHVLRRRHQPQLVIGDGRLAQPALPPEFLLRQAPDRLRERVQQDHDQPQDLRISSFRHVKRSPVSHLR
jgi:hypothetical protein